MSEDEAVPRDVLSLDRYALAMAHVAFFVGLDRGALLEKLGIAADLWEASDKYWLGALSREMSDKAAPVARAFARHFGAGRRDLEGRQPKLEDVVPIIALADPRAPFVASDETAYLPAVADADATLPFHSGAATPPVVIADDAPHVDVGATAMLPIIREAPATPFPEKTARQLTPAAWRAHFPLMQWASLSAEIHIHAQDRAGVLSRYRLNETQFEGLRAAWGEQLDRAPAERQEYERLVATYRAVLAGGRSG